MVRIFFFYVQLIYCIKKTRQINFTYSKTREINLSHIFFRNKNWDEWVPEARMLKYTELNLEKKRDLVKAHEANVRAKKNAIKWKADNPSATSATTSPTSSGDGPSKDAKQAKFDEVRFFT